MDLRPLLLRAGAEAPLETAAGVEAVGPLSGLRVSIPSTATVVLHPGDLKRIPDGDEGIEDAGVVVELPVVVASSMRVDGPSGGAIGGSGGPRFPMPGNPSSNDSPLAPGSCLMIMGWRASASERNTSARSTTPSSIRGSVRPTRYASRRGSHSCSRSSLLSAVHGMGCIFGMFVASSCRSRSGASVVSTGV
jgi:hypothetical protein